MFENLVSKLTSYRWLKEATSGRVKTLINRRALEASAHDQRHRKFVRDRASPHSALEGVFLEQPARLPKVILGVKSADGIETSSTRCRLTLDLAAIGDIGRFKSPRKLVSYFGLNHRVRQSGRGAAHRSRPMLVEAA